MRIQKCHAKGSLMILKCNVVKVEMEWTKEQRVGFIEEMMLWRIFSKIVETFFLFPTSLNGM